MRIELCYKDGLLWLEGCGIDRPRDFDDPAPLAALIGEYARLRRRRPSDEAALREVEAGLRHVGEALYQWLDGRQRWLQRALGTLSGAFELEVQTSHTPDAMGWALLHAPWELLADGSGFLADRVRAFAPVRRLGAPTASPALDTYRLGIAFMAAAPRDQVDLDHEAEEAAILDAAGADMDMFVEESGEAGELGRRLGSVTPPLPVLHLSCHGKADWRGDDGRQPAAPVLLLEDRFGDAAPVTAAELDEALGGYRPRLLFVSACETAERKSDGTAAGEAVADSLAAQLVRDAGIAAVVGWEGSVADVAATSFARSFYAALARRSTPGLAAAAARRALLGRAGAAGGFAAGKEATHGDALQAELQGTSVVMRRDWHLARVWLGPEGGGALVGLGDLAARRLLAQGEAHKQILERKGGAGLEVASPAMFVGRRRELQSALRLLAPGGRRGLLLHGLGRVGKSSLAARIADRTGLTLVVVFKRYSASAIFDELENKLSVHPAARTLLARYANTARHDPVALEALLLDLLTGPCAQVAAGYRPMLLLVDDLEQVLEADAAGGRHRVMLAAEPVLASVLRAFQRAEGSASRLIVTSRYTFTLMDGDRDWAETLAALELGEFGTRAARKLAMRQIRAAPASATLAARLPLLERAEQLARGHPGLQDLLGAQVALRPDLRPEQAATLLDAVEAWLTGGAEDDLPPDLTIRRFVEALNIGEPLALAGAVGQEVLRGATLFALPVPETALLALPGSGAAIVARLRDLGLLVTAEDPVNHRVSALAASAVASARLLALTPEEVQRVVRFALPLLFEIWAERKISNFESHVVDYELTRLALFLRDKTDSSILTISVCARLAVRWLSVHHKLRDATKLGVSAIQILRRSGYPVPPGLAIRTIMVLFRDRNIFTERASRLIAKIAISNNGIFSDEEEYGLFAIYEGRAEEANIIFDRIRTAYENENKNLEARYIKNLQARDIK